MIYEWKCKGCGKIEEVVRPASEYNIPPDDKHEWFRLIRKPAGVPFETLRMSGVFADKEGNFAPRKVE
jgi:hypothetical protein